jgi:DNA-binding transcriptional ArsR family regulator
MPLLLPPTAPTLLIRKSAFERVEMTRAQVDEALGLTPDEFRIEGSLIAIGPLVGEDTLSELIERLEDAGLVYYDDFFELSGNWPEWLRLFAMDASV